MNIGRNEPCPCGSGKKYKKCCLDKDQEKEKQALKAKTDDDFYFNDSPFSDKFLEDLPDDPFDDEYPEITKEEEQLVEDWWGEYEDLEGADNTLRHIEQFLELHPQLVENLGLETMAVFELGADFRREGRMEDFIVFLLRLREEFPSTYERSAGYYDSDIIAWLVSQGREAEISRFLDYFRKNPVDFVDELFGVINLLMAKDLTEPLSFLVSEVKDGLINSPGIINGEDIIIPLIYDKLDKYLKGGGSRDDFQGFVEEVIKLFPYELDKENEIGVWSQRLNNIKRPYSKWDYDQNWSKARIVDVYFEISDNFMRYLHEDFGLSWVSAQYHSSMIYDYGKELVESGKGKKKKQMFDFNRSMILAIADEICLKGFFRFDATMALSLFNAIYYFAAYLEKCELIDRVYREEIEENVTSVYEEVYPKLLIAHPEALCFGKFPFWDGLEREKSE